MSNIFTDKIAVRALGWTVFLSLACLVATPIRSTVFIVLLMLYSLGYLWVRRGETYAKLTMLDWVVITALLAMTIGRLGPFVLSGFSGRYISPGLHVAASIPAFLMIRRAVNGQDVVHYLHRFIAYGLFVGGVGAAIVAVWQTQILSWRRADGFLFSINFGYMSGAIFSLCLGLLLGKKYKALLIIGAVGACIAVILSGSRGAIFPLPIIIFIWSLLNYKKLGLRYVLLVLFAVPLISWGVYSSSDSVKNRIDVGMFEVAQMFKGDFKREGSFSYRVQLWGAAIETVKQKPVFGMTYPEREDLISELVNNHGFTPWMKSIPRGHAHSQYFETLATGGIVGIACLAVYLFLPMTIFLMLFIKQNENIFALAGLLFVSSYSLFGLTEVLMQQEMIAAVYGLLLVLIYIVSKSFYVFNDTDC